MYYKKDTRKKFHLWDTKQFEKKYVQYYTYLKNISLRRSCNNLFLSPTLNKFYENYRYNCDNKKIYGYISNKEIEIDLTK